MIQSTKEGRMDMTHDEQVTKANEVFAELNRAREIFDKGNTRTEQDDIALECFGFADHVSDVIGVERMLRDAGGGVYVLADVLLRAIAMESLPAEEREAIWRARDERSREREREVDAWQRRDATRPER
jgi:hypothetical protein